jgi:small subunit ribosomal protein S18
MTREARKPKQQQFKKKKRRPCFFCVEKKILDYKDLGLVRRFMTDRGKIAPRRLTGCCALHQRMVAQVIKKTRQIGLVPYSVE